MKKSSENLHILIKSLTKSEKGYFLKYSGLNNQYTRLFKAIDSQQTYNEPGLRSLFKNELFIKQLHVAKNYLLKVILKSLNKFSAGISINNTFSEIIGYAANLYRKGLYRESLNQITKGKQLARYYEKYDFMPELIRWEKNILINHFPVDISVTFEKLSEEEYEAVNILTNLCSYRKLYGRIYSMLRIKGSARGRKEESDFKKIISDSLLKDISGALSYEAKLLYLQIHMINAQSEANDEIIYRFSKTMVWFMNTHPAGISDFEREYVFAMIENLSAAFNLGKFKEALQIITD